MVEYFGVVYSENPAGYKGANLIKMLGSLFPKRKEINSKYFVQKKLLESANSEFGCRLIESQMRELVLPKYIELLKSDKGVFEIIIKYITLWEQVCILVLMISFW